MNDVFVERMVKKKFETTDLLVVIGVIAAIIILSLVGFYVGFVVVKIGRAHYPTFLCFPN